MKNKYGITTFNNGAEVRLKNRRVKIIHKEDEGVLLEFAFATNDADKPACNHRNIKDKIRVSSIKLTEETMDYLVQSYVHYKKSKKDNQ